MSEEVIDVETKTDETQHQMYVQQIDFDTFKTITQRVTNVGKLFVYNMPNKASKYIDDIPEMIKTLDSFLTQQEQWRITSEKTVSYKCGQEIYVGDWVINDVELILCIPKINSFIIVPNGQSTFKGTKSPTSILQLSNCISIMPMLLVMKDQPDPQNQGKFNISMGYQFIVKDKETVKTDQE